MTYKHKKHVQMQLSDRRWRGLEFEADLLSQVFRRPATPEMVAQTMMDRAFQDRDRRLSK